MFTFFKELFLGKPFQFHTEYTLLEAYEKLALLSERDHLKYPSWRQPTTVLQISSNYTGKHGVDFTSHRETSANFQIDVDGYIEPSHDGMHIIGDIKLRKIKRLYLDLTPVLAISSVVLTSIMMTRQSVADSLLIGGIAFWILLGSATIELMLSQRKVYNQI